MKKISQNKLVEKFFIANPNKDIEHAEAVDWLTARYKKLTGNVFRDPDRQIRSLHQKGFLIKVKKGIYRYDPKATKQRELENFTARQKKIILKRDGYKCVICARGFKEGSELHIDHIKPKDLGGKAIVENGQTLCSQHNFLKKNLKQTETGKKMYIRLYELAKKEQNKELLKFVTDILEVYEKHGINGHIIWDK
ncbi:MAG: HNH endonuclease [Endomicrobium sp.]|jgi:5-methylcytosine-specific restriction endonuclease McrA|nr:HNH endonuclease [Endomicrobium sp.]